MNTNLESQLDFTIRQAKESDLEDIIKLWEILGEFHARLDPVFEPSPTATEIARKYFQEQLSQEKTSILLAEDRKTKAIMGYCKGSISSYPPLFKINEIGQISDLVVDSSYRKHHIGQHLYTNMRSWFQEKGITRIELSVASANPISPKFWEKMGFQEVRRVLYQNLSK